MLSSLKRVQNENEINHANMASSAGSEEEEPSNECEILIIGAGLAGLSAANLLSKHGMRDFQILEARNRIGGRVISINLGPHRIELGAMCIHGVLGNPIYELALANKLININLDKKRHMVAAFTEQGERVPLQILQEMYEIYFYFLKRCEEFYLCRIPTPAHVRSVGEHLKADIGNYLRSLPPDQRRLRRQIFDNLLSRETCISGCNTMADIDLAEFGSYFELPGGNLEIDKGFSSILECLLPPLPINCIHKEHTVKKIRWDLRNKFREKENGSILSPGATPESGDVEHSEPVEQRDIEVECENGKKFYADHVLVTIPLGVLKERAVVLFEPPLPQYKMEAIGRLSFGTVNKIFLEYERPFLRPDLSEIIILWEPEPSSGSSPVSSPATTWYRKIYSFVRINEVMLMAFISGEEAVFAETLSAECIADTCTDILRKFLKDPYVPTPSRVVRTRWNSEVNTRGAYTAIAVGSSQEDIENLAKPIYRNPCDSKPVLLFAGEATHPTYYSTTHGALLTGRAAAQYLLEPDSPKEKDSSDLAELSSWIKGIPLA